MKMSTRVPRRPLGGVALVVVLLSVGLAWPGMTDDALADETVAGERASLLVDEAWLAARQGVVRLAVSHSPEEAAQSETLSWSPPDTVASVDEVRSALGVLGLSGSETLVLSGADPETIARAFWWLERVGAREVRVLGGSAAGDGKPITEEGTTFGGGGSRAETASIPLREARASLGQRGFELLDLRDGVDWAAQRHVAPPEFRGGHIPGALPFDFVGLMAEDGSWPEVETLRRRLGRVGPRPSTRVSLESTFVLYGDGPDDPHPMLGYFLLRLAGVEARVLAEGWPGWIGEEYPTVQILDAQEVAAMLEAENPGLEADGSALGVIVFDNRGEGAYREAHLPGATSLAAESFLEELEPVVAEQWPGVDRNEVAMVFYCYGRECVRSRYCSTKAAEAGFRRLYWFREGMPGWQQAGLPVFSGPSR